MMKNKALLMAQALLKLTLLDAETGSVKNSEVYAQLQELGLPEEVVSRLHELITATKKVGSRVFAVGKIVILKILDFVKAHPLLVVGAGIGAVVGVAVTSLITSIPLFGQLLAPVAIALGIAITVVGAVAGHRLDKQFPKLGEDITKITQQFFSLLIDIFNTVFPSFANA